MSAYYGETWGTYTLYAKEIYTIQNHMAREKMAPITYKICAPSLICWYVINHPTPPWFHLLYFEKLASLSTLQHFFICTTLLSTTFLPTCLTHINFHILIKQQKTIVANSSSLHEHEFHRAKARLHQYIETISNIFELTMT